MSCPAGVISSCDFAQYLVDQLPYYDELILEDITPTGSWIGNISTGTWEAFTGVEHTLDRFTDVYPDTTKAWERVQNASCLGNPCDPTANMIGFGAKRLTYFLERQSWQTQLLCYDQEMHVTHASEHFAQIISNVLRPATQTIMNNWIRTRALQNAGRTWYASSSMSTFTFVFTAVGDSVRFFDCSVAPTAVFKLTPQMLQRRFLPLMAIGYGGKNPFKEVAPFIELVTDIDTLWELDRLGGQTGVGGTAPSIAGNWRFEQWEAANKFWRYGYSGQLGNFMTRTDIEGLRFNYLQDLGAAFAPNRYRYQIVLPYRNVATSGAGGAAGLGRIFNEDYQNAHFGISFIWHKKAMEALVADAKPINPQMPFSSRNFGGKWQFVMDNLGADVNGTVIANPRRNKGYFLADFKLGLRPLYTEFCEGIFHKREPMCVYNIDTCNSDLLYPTQSYNSANAGCPTAIQNLDFQPTLSSPGGTYEVAANSILCDNSPVSHQAITGTSTLATLVAQLNSLVSVMGNWQVVGATTIRLASTGDCVDVTIPWNV